MLQEIEPHIFDNNYYKRSAKKGDIILCFGKNEIYLREDSRLPSGYQFPTYEEIFTDHNEDNDESLHYLFSIDKAGYFLLDKADLPNSGASIGKYKFHSMQIFRSMGEGDTVPLAMMTGLHLYNWMKRNQYCGNCGEKTVHKENERALQCPSCGNLIFPHISPVVAVAIVDEDKLLMAKNAQGNINRFSILAGFVEIGESLEQTVHREVYEEVGLKVKNLRYYNSQPWGLTNIEMMGFFVDLDGSNKITIQEEELAEAKWFKAEDIDWEMPTHSLSYTMIKEFKMLIRKNERTCKCSQIN